MTEPKKVKLHTIPIDSEVSIKVSGAFHKRLVGVYFSYVANISKEDFEEISAYWAKGELDKLTGKILIDAKALETLLRLIAALEKEFLTNGFDEEKEYEIPATEG